MAKRFEPDIIDDTPLGSRFFLKIFRRKPKAMVREGALQPDELKKIINDIGRGRKVNITRMTYDGTVEDKPVNVKIIDIRDDHFVGKVVNVERNIKQSQDKNLVYVKGGGGTIEFFYKDGDIQSVVEDIDQQIIEQRNVDEIREILDALDLDEDVIISYYDVDQGGVINGAGKLIDKNIETLDFTLRLDKINEIELAQPKEVILNLDKDNILDLEVVI